MSDEKECFGNQNQKNPFRKFRKGFLNYVKSKLRFKRFNRNVRFVVFLFGEFHETVYSRM